MTEKTTKSRRLFKHSYTRASEKVRRNDASLTSCFFRMRRRVDTCYGEEKWKLFESSQGECVQQLRINLKLALFCWQRINADVKVSGDGCTRGETCVRIVYNFVNIGPFCFVRLIIVSNLERGISEAEKLNFESFI